MNHVGLDLLLPICRIHGAAIYIYINGVSWIPSIYQHIYQHHGSVMGIHITGLKHRIRSHEIMSSQIKGVFLFKNTAKCQWTIILFPFTNSFLCWMAKAYSYSCWLENCIWFRWRPGPHIGLFNDGEHDQWTSGFGPIFGGYPISGKPILNPNIESQYFGGIKPILNPTTYYTSDENLYLAKTNSTTAVKKNVGSFLLGRNPIEKWDAQWICREMV